MAKGKPILANILVDRPDVTAGAGTRCCGSGRMRDDAMPGAWVRVKVRAGFSAGAGPIWRYATGGRDTGHLAVFPCGLPWDYISWTNAGDLVVDPMVGSGATLRAAADLGRRELGIEINPECCELIRRRAQSVLPLDG